MQLKTDTRSCILVLIVLSLFAFSCDKNENIEHNSRDVQASLDGVVDSLFMVFNNKWGIEKGGIHLYVTGPLGNYQASSNIESYLSPDTQFRIASISKTFTAASIMLLNQEGKLNLKDNFIEYLPNTPAYDIPYKNDITIEQLLQHRSGVFDVTNEYIPETVNAPYAGVKYETYVRAQDNQHTFTFDELVGINAEHQLSKASPNEGFNYSNTGYNILGKVIEEVSGKTYSEFVHENFITPLNLTNTYGVWEGGDMEMRSQHLKSYLYINGEENEIETTKDNMSVHVSEGNIVSMPRDITRWMRLLLTGNAGVNAANVELMKEMKVADSAHGVYGLGLVFDEGLGYGHNGAHISYISSLRYNPNNDITILVSSTFIHINEDADSDSNDLFELGFAIRDLCYSVINEYQK